jgi:transcription initiation factor TFIIB
VVVTRPEVVEELCSDLELPSDVCDRAKELLTAADIVGATKRLPARVVAAGVVAAACRELCHPLPAHIVAAFAGATARSVFRFLRQLASSVSLRIITDARCYARRLAGLLGLSEEEARAAEELCERASKANISSGRDYVALAAACVYIANRLVKGWNTEVTQRRLCHITGVSEVTLRKRIREIAERLGVKI